jgi:Histone chaperone domain CHZ
MSAQNGSAVTGDHDVDITDAPAIDKGKGKAVPREVEEDDTSEEETADEGVCRTRSPLLSLLPAQTAMLMVALNRLLTLVRCRPLPQSLVALTGLSVEVDEEDDDDDMAEIDTSNIITSGRRTRGKTIDFAKAAQEEDAPEEDEEDDEDFEVVEEDGDAMQE